MTDDEKIESAGVFDETTGKWLARVATDRRPSSGQYAMTDGGIYAFSSADEGHEMLIMYHPPGPMVSLTPRHERRRA